MMIEATTFYIVIPVWVTFKVTVVRELKNFGVQFLFNLCIDLNEIQYVATTCSFVEAHFF